MSWLRLQEGDVGCLSQARLTLLCDNSTWFVLLSKSDPALTYPNKQMFVQMTSRSDSFVATAGVRT